MRLRYQKKPGFGPIRIRTGNGRMVSWSFVRGRLSWNSRTRRWHPDAPVPGDVEFGGEQAEVRPASPRAMAG